MNIIRIRCICKKVIKNENNYTFVFDNYDQDDMKKLLDAELAMIKNSVDANNSEQLKIKSCVNSYEHFFNEIHKSEFETRQVMWLDTKLNYLKTKSNIKIHQLENTINKLKKNNLILYVKITKLNSSQQTIMPILEVFGIEVLENSINKTNLIVNMIKQSKNSEV